MTIDEAIKYAEEVAEEKERDRDVRKIHLDNRRSHNNLVHYEKACKCAEEHRQLAEWLKELKKLKEQEPCEDCISRTALMIALIDKGLDQIQADDLTEINQIVTDLPSIQPNAKIGHWFYDKSIENWRCSECKETPKTMGYCGSANFMAEHFKFCNHCGARMVEPQESEGKE